MISFDALFREAQREVLQYKSGKMAVVAVPGSGKTLILVQLAVSLIRRMSAKDIERGREILLVTFSNSAVNTLQNRVETLLGEPASEKRGYRIRTLHGLARDIISEHPALVGLSDDYRILDEQITQQIIQEAAQVTLRTYLDAFDEFIADSVRADEKRIDTIRQRSLPDMAVQVCKRIIKHCKDHSLTPEDLRAKAIDGPIFRYIVAVYEEYQQRLAYRSAVDFDDLLMLALRALQEDDKLKVRLQKRWVYVLEDEAQDSSLLQEKLLRLLSGDKNWVRVGDPNQSINSTFTTARPEFLRDFVREEGVTTVTLNQSGRSGRPIIDFANALVKWSSQLHPVKEVRKALDLRLIEPVRFGDPNSNPPTSETNIHTFYQPGKDVSPEQELQVVMQSLQRWLTNNPDKTVAVLVPENRHGYQFAEMLRQAGMHYDELLRTTADVRQTVRALLTVLNYLADPLNVNLLSAIYRDVWWGHRLGSTSVLATKYGNGEIKTLANAVHKTIDQYKNTEDFLYPSPAEGETFSNRFSHHPQEVREDLQDFRSHVQRWTNAFYLPADQLVLTIARDIFNTADNLAIAYQVASFLRLNQDLESPRSLRELTAELRSISENQRRYFDMDATSSGYEPTPGVVTIATLHAAKGLEWDRVYILGVNNRSFPEGKDNETYTSERWFLRDQLNLEVEIPAMLDAALHAVPYSEGEATRAARIAYAAERLRLLYVGITRAKEEVILLWNMGYQWRQTSSAAEPALALKALQEYLDGSLSF
jgi:DNA helicase-2/ATP-dependent DNA helicase PcrA